jgi:Flp pilus assembly protein TadG
MTPAVTRFGHLWHLRRFVRNRDGVSAVEFALVLPVMLSLYIGGVEVGDGMAINFKATLAARTVTDLASQYVSIDNATMSSILGAASTVLTPYPTANVVVTVSEVTTNAQGAGTVTWSDSLNGTARTVGSSITLPTKLQSANITILFGEVTYPYTPSMGYVLTGTINIYESVYFYPRMSTTIARVNS